MKQIPKAVSIKEKNKECREWKYPNIKNELSQLQKKLLQKVYIDLFQSDPNYFKSKQLTYENFLYYFYKDVLTTFNYKNTNDSYDKRLVELESIIHQKFPSASVLSSLSPLAKKHLELKQKQDADWEIVNKYQAALYQDEQKKQMASIAKSLHDYYEDITKQIEQKKTYEIDMEKRRLEEKKAKEAKEKEKMEKTKIPIQQAIKQLLANEEYLSMEMKKNLKSKLARETVVKQTLQSLLEESNEMTMETKDYIHHKIDIIAEDQRRAFVNKATHEVKDCEIASVVDAIIAEKNAKVHYNALIKGCSESNEDNSQMKDKGTMQLFIDTELEDAVNKIMKGGKAAQYTKKKNI